MSENWQQVFDHRDNHSNSRATRSQTSLRHEGALTGSVAATLEEINAKRAILTSSPKITEVQEKCPGDSGHFSIQRTTHAAALAAAMLDCCAEFIMAAT